MDNRFVEYLHNGAVRIDVYRAMGTKYDIIATGQLTLRRVITEAALGANRKMVGMIELSGVDRPGVVLVELTCVMHLTLTTLTSTPTELTAGADACTLCAYDSIVFAISL